MLDFLDALIFMCLPDVSPSSEQDEKPKPTKRQRALAEMKRRFPRFDSIQSFRTPEGIPVLVQDYPNGKTVRIGVDEFMILPDYKIYLKGAHFHLPED